jgi:hypothetical protein
MSCGNSCSCSTKPKSACGCGPCTGQPVATITGGDQVSQRNALLAKAQIYQDQQAILQAFARFLRATEGGCLKCR